MSNWKWYETREKTEKRKREMKTVRSTNERNTVNVVVGNDKRPRKHVSRSSCWQNERLAHMTSDSHFVHSERTTTHEWIERFPKDPNYCWLRHLFLFCIPCINCCNCCFFFIFAFRFCTSSCKAVICLTPQIIWAERFFVLKLKTGSSFRTKKFDYFKLTTAKWIFAMKHWTEIEEVEI